MEAYCVPSAASSAARSLSRYARFLRSSARLVSSRSTSEPGTLAVWKCLDGDVFSTNVAQECLDSTSNSCKASTSFSGQECQSVHVGMISNDRSKFVDRLWQVMVAVGSK